MFICHIALQGCLTLEDVPYGITADTGGHIKYLLELAAASAQDESVDRIDIVTRGFRNAQFGDRYQPGQVEQRGKIKLVRLDDGDARYLPKEDLWTRKNDLTEAFLAYLGTLDRLPDLIHAHYADAGYVASMIKQRLGIPYIFTGHSLGAVKRQANGQSTPSLERRIVMEEDALERADAVIASSLDEAEAQYAHYGAIEGGRIRVIPPGCDLERFQNAMPSDKVRRDINRFLREPDKPMILAIARPVRKKNLLGLIEAFARDRALQEAANLVIVAGCRSDLEELEPECRDVCKALLEAVDQHDLYGKVAYPKSHEPEDIPAYYALARESGGVFVNPALNEPFGLTLLEAAAARLPVVATDSGGPNDIIERCGNGLLVCPHDVTAIAKACRTIIADRTTRIRYAAAGVNAVTSYDWAAHRTVYHRLVEDLIAPPRVHTQRRRLLVCDIDNTLLGDREALKKFLSWHAASGDETYLGIATGRSFHSAQAILAAEGVPNPDVIISSVGAQIHWFDDERRCFVEDERWKARIARDWDADAIAALAARIELRRQGPLEQRVGKSSYFLDDHDPVRVAKIFAEKELSVEVVASHGRYLDILPYGVGKHSAVLHAGEKLGLLQSQVIVAGDSGNDRSMLRACPHPIVVGNWSDGLLDDPALSHAYVASATHAAGILEGVRHYQKAGSW